MRGGPIELIMRHSSSSRMLITEFTLIHKYHHLTFHTNTLMNYSRPSAAGVNFNHHQLEKIYNKKVIRFVTWCFRSGVQVTEVTRRLSVDSLSGPPQKNSFLIQINSCSFLVTGFYSCFHFLFLFVSIRQ